MSDGRLPPVTRSHEALPSPVSGRVTAAILLPLLLVLGACWIERTPPRQQADEGADTVVSIASELRASAGAWNRGDLDGFMQPYLDSPGTTYIGGSGLVTGYEDIRARYAPLFEPGAERDSLRFEEIEVRSLGEDHRLATLRFVLHREGRRTASGPVTLVLRATEEGWRILHDHSSSDDDE